MENNFHLSPLAEEDSAASSVYDNCVHRLPARVQQFIFDHVDSVAFLETVLLLFAQPGRLWSIQEVAAELRNHPNSTESYLQAMKRLKLVREIRPGVFEFAPVDTATADTIADLAASYKVHRHRILELIFSPLKRARDFVDAFKRDEKKEDESE